MTIRTMLVHLAPDPDCEARLNAAVSMAKRLEAHLTTLYVAVPVHMPAGAEGRGASIAYLAAARETAREKAAEVEARAKAACEAAGVTWSWVFGEADHLEDLLEHVHHVDLTVINQVSFDSFEDRLMFQLPEKLVIGAGGPVLVLPKGTHDLDVNGFGTVLIAWTYSKEAIRAVRDAMPLLHRADKVRVLSCGPGPKDADADAVEKEIMFYLESHEIEAEHISHSVRGHAGEEILDTAEAVKADLIVMGAYSHTSFLDKLFGSASRYVISHTTVPILMSH
jgi:nucleotide-binding universal stress UspA family protein